MLCRLLPERESSEKADLGTKLHAAAVSGDMTGLEPEHVKWIEAYVKITEGWAREVLVFKLVHPLHFGTIDAMSCAKRVLSIIDFKTGKWPVDPVENQQLIGYASEVVEDFDTVRLGVFQPQVSMKPKWWVLTREQLNPYVEAYEKSAYSCFDNPTFVEGDHCRFCAAKGAVCSAMRRAHQPAAMDW